MLGLLCVGHSSMEEDNRNRGVQTLGMEAIVVGVQFASLISTGGFSNVAHRCDIPSSSIKTSQPPTTNITSPQANPLDDSFHFSYLS